MAQKRRFSEAGSQRTSPHGEDAGRSCGLFALAAIPLARAKIPKAPFAQALMHLHLTCCGKRGMLQDLTAKRSKSISFRKIILLDNGSLSLAGSAADVHERCEPKVDRPEGRGPCATRSSFRLAFVGSFWLHLLEKQKVERSSIEKQSTGRRP